MADDLGWLFVIDRLFDQSFLDMLGADLVNQGFQTVNHILVSFAEVSLGI